MTLLQASAGRRADGSHNAVSPSIFLSLLSLWILNNVLLFQSSMLFQGLITLHLLPEMNPLYSSGRSPCLVRANVKCTYRRWSGQAGIATNEAARTKWVHIKHFAAAVSSTFKMMLHRDAAIADGAHQEAGDTRFVRNKEQVLNVSQGVDENPCISESDHLITLVTGEHAQSDVKTDHVKHVKEIGHNAVTHNIVGQEKKVEKLTL